MEVSGSSAYYAGLSSVQAGQNRLNQTANAIATTSVERSATSQSTDVQAQRLRAVDRSQQDLAGSMIDLAYSKLQMEAGVKVEKASDQALGTMIDTFA